MDARAYYREVLEEAARLGLGFWERLALILGAALVVVSFRHLGESMRGIRFKVEVVPALEPISDGGVATDRDLPPAREGGGEPGGGPEGGMG